MESSAFTWAENVLDIAEDTARIGPTPETRRRFPGIQREPTLVSHTVGWVQRLLSHVRLPCFAFELRLATRQEVSVRS
jgi:hypothetical protein